LAPQIQEALAPLKPGEFTDIIKTDQGYQIFYLEDFETHSADHFEKVKDKIEDKLYKQVINQQYEKWLQDLRTRAHIKLIR
jgi:peptidyl-prolyl cis-trans isomerase SurA